MPKRIHHFDFLADNFQPTKIWRINGGQQNLDAWNSELDSKTILSLRRQNCLTKFTRYSFDRSFLESVDPPIELSEKCRREPNSLMAAF